jgi:DNA end-binding protein Ku
MGAPAQAKSMWKGTVSFGLVVLPVKLYATSGSDENGNGHQHHDVCTEAPNHGRIRMIRECSDCSEMVPYANIVKGYEYGGQVITLDDCELASLPLSSTKEIAIGHFCALDEVDPLLYAKSYYLMPDKGGEKAYALLRQAMQAESVAGVATITLRSREAVCIIYPRGAQLVLTTLAYAADVRPPLMTEHISVPEEQQIMAQLLVDSLRRPWNPQEHSDSYAEALAALIADKAANGHVSEPQSAASVPDAAGNLMAALQASLTTLTPDKS